MELNIRKQAELLSYGISEEIIDHKKLVAWVDQVISESEKVENWMIDISLSKKAELYKVEGILGKLFGHCFEGSFTEFIALMAYKVALAQIPVFDCYPVLTIAKDAIIMDQSDIDSIVAKELMEKLEDHVEKNHFNDESIENATKKLKKLLSFAKNKHPEVFEFLHKFA